MKRVAVTGMGIISPVGNSVEKFWSSISGGKSGIGFITKFDTEDFKVKIAAEVKDFDPLEYMDKAAVRKTDEFVRFALAAAAQAMADSALEEQIAPERLGVYYGSGIGGFHTFMQEHANLINKGSRRVSPMFIPKMIPNMAAGEIAIKFHAAGPCISVSTACATGTSCIGEGYRAIAAGYADAAIVGGAESSVNELAIAGFTNCMALCETNDPENASIPFDKRRCGFVVGEGAGALVLEEYEHAKKRGAHIYAEVTGYGSTCDAHHITAPDPEANGAARAFADAAAQSGYSENDAVYINAHGTSTPLNDKTETLAIKKAFGEKAADISVSSTKSMTGHMLGAAGAAEAVAAILALNNGIVPPTIGYKEKDPECDLDCTPNTAKERDITLAMSSSLGFGGHNACIAFRKAE